MCSVVVVRASRFLSVSHVSVTALSALQTIQCTFTIPRASFIIVQNKKLRYRTLALTQASFQI